MSSFSFLHMADLHLGSPFHGLTGLNGRMRHTMVGMPERALEQAVNVALEQRVSFVLMAGDVFDTSERSLKCQLFLKDQFERLQEQNIHVYIVYGNHDPITEGRHRLVWPDNVYVFGADGVQRVTHHAGDLMEVDIYGVSFDREKGRENMARAFRREREVFSVGLLHTNCDTTAGHAQYYPCTQTDLLQARMDYWALGHVHQGKVVHENPWIVYPGNTQGRHIRETGEKGCYVVHVHDLHHLKPVFHACAQVVWHELQLELDEPFDVHSFIARLEQVRMELRSSFFPRSVIVRISLTGPGGNLNGNLDEHLLKEAQAYWNDSESPDDRFVWVEQIRWDATNHELGQWPGEHTAFEDMDRTVQALLGDDMLRDQVFADVLQDLYTHYGFRKHGRVWNEQEQKEIILQAVRMLKSEWLEGSS